MSEATSLARVFEFLETCDKLKSVSRSAWLTDHSRHENSAEHSWHLAVFCLLMQRELKVQVDSGRVIELVLCHDLVEILAGDTNVYDVAGRLAQQQREAAAATELFGLLPDDLGRFVDGCWREFEAAETPEARFAKAMDRLQAMAQNCFAGGRAWREHGVTEAMSRAVNGPAIDACSATRPAFEAIFRRATENDLWAEG